MTYGIDVKCVRKINVLKNQKPNMGCVGKGNDLSRKLFCGTVRSRAKLVNDNLGDMMILEIPKG